MVKNLEAAGPAVGILETTSCTELALLIGNQVYVVYCTCMPIKHYDAGL